MILNHPLFAILVIGAMVAITFLTPYFSVKADRYWTKYAEGHKMGNRLFSFWFGTFGSDRSRALDARIYRQDLLCKSNLEKYDPFSAKSKLAKAANRRSVLAPSRRGWVKAAAAFLLILTMPVLVSKAAGSEFFYRVWGALGKENIESHEEVLYDEEKGTSCIVTYPKREYTNDALDKAEELIGNSASFVPLVKEIGDTRLTVLAVAYDGDAAVVEFTLEKEGGVEGLRYGQLDNESKGAWLAEDAPFRFFFADCGESIYVDLEKSTENILYCRSPIRLAKRSMSMQMAGISAFPRLP